MIPPNAWVVHRLLYPPGWTYTDLWSDPPPEGSITPGIRVVYA